ncbi:GNAT family N-acetyltransferase [Alicyclobacillus sp. ALC3]|uniref:GNAT family N-acetyltransferase n=1 Tax=Alicyclobacillus sp. ALC3 TaxID=2796143 RepID=UPI002378BD78|nr:GNAT family protein [Alicyclobacillus sp. ALC3]WDL96427.1 GNAT family N-acetyltransferase [Alicyclobacillus sp. ALC3]
MFYHKVDDEIHLKLLELRDAEQVFGLIDAGRSYLREWLPWVDASVSAEQTREFISMTLQQFASNHGFQAGITYQGQLAGVIGFHHVNWEHNQVSIGYWLGEDFQRRGIMTRACRAMVNIAFWEYGLHRIEIRAGVGNQKSRAIPERLGFTLEGVCRQVERHSSGYIDHAVYGLLAQEWKGRR